MKREAKTTLDSASPDSQRHGLLLPEAAELQALVSQEQPPGRGLLLSGLSCSQAFSEYQIQQMTANFVDQFGFSDEEFADQDDNIK